MSQNPTLTEGCGEQSSPLINGFKAIEDVLTFIKQQERRIEKLEDKNYEQEEKIKELEEKKKELVNGRQELHIELENKTDECEEMKKELTHVQENLDEMMDFTYFKQMKKLERDVQHWKGLYHHIKDWNCQQRYGELVEKDMEIHKLKEENKKLKMMIDYLPNDMEDKWWCEKNERWRWDDDGFQEEESEEEPEPPESEEESEEESE